MTRLAYPIVHRQMTLAHTAGEIDINFREDPVGGRGAQELAKIQMLEYQYRFVIRVSDWCNYIAYVRGFTN